MTANLTQAGNDLFYLEPGVTKKTTETDTIVNYSDYLSDSLNTFSKDTVFRFELKQISLPADSTDSIRQPVFNTPSVFQAYGKHRVAEPVERPRQNYDWLTALFLICMIILAWVRVYNVRRIRQLFKAVIARHHVNQLMRDGNLAEERLTPGLAFIFLVSLATLIFRLGFDNITVWLGIREPVLIYLIILGSISVLWFIKILAIRGTGLIFKTRQDTGELILTNLIFNASAGILLFPLVLAGYYINNLLFLKIAAGIMLLIILLRFFRSLSVGISAQTFSVLYLFFYLCTLEILPVIFLYRLVTLAY